MLNLGVERYITPVTFALKKAHPGIDIAYSTEKPRSIFEKLLDGSLDVGFFPGSTYDDKGSLSYLFLGREEVRVAVSSSSEAAKRDALTPEDLADNPLICLKEHETTDLMNALVFSAGFHPRQVVETEELEIAAALIVELNGYFAIPEFMFARFDAFPNITIVPMENPVYQNISFAYKTANENPTLGLFLEQARRLFSRDDKPQPSTRA